MPEYDKKDLRIFELERQVAELRELVARLTLAQTTKQRPTEAEIAPVDPGPVVSSFSPPPAKEVLTTARSPHDPLADLLGFPKEGR